MKGKLCFFAFISLLDQFLVYAFGRHTLTPTIQIRLSSFVQMYTLSGGARPFGVATLLAGYDKRGPRLYLIEPSGVSLVSRTTQK